MSTKSKVLHSPPHPKKEEKRGQGNGPLTLHPPPPPKNENKKGLVGWTRLPLPFSLTLMCKYSVLTYCTHILYSYSVITECTYIVYSQSVLT